MDSLHGIDIFVAVAEAGSFSRGAARLQISPAQASQQIKRTESRLGVLLVDRSTRHVRLTEEGKAFYAAAREIMRTVTEAELRMTEMGATPQGRLRVEAPVVLIDAIILPVLQSFREAYPMIALEFIHSDQVFGGMHPECEVILRLGPFADTSMIAHSLPPVSMGTFAAPAYLERRGVPQRPEDLNDHECINFVNPVTGTIHPWTYVRDEESVTFTPAPGLGFNQGESRLAAALHGLGIYRGMKLGLDEYVRSGRLKAILSDWDTDGPPIIVAYSGGRVLSRRARSFVEHLRSHYAC